MCSFLIGPYIDLVKPNWYIFFADKSLWFFSVFWSIKYRLLFWSGNFLQVSFRSGSTVTGSNFDRWIMIEFFYQVVRACNISPFSPCLTGPMDYPFASCHKGPGFKSPGGYLRKTGIPLLALSCYIGDPDMIDHHCGFVWGGPRPELSLWWSHLISHSFPVLISRSLQVSLLASQPTESAADPNCDLF
jgi:hypothetical protein